MYKKVNALLLAIMLCLAASPAFALQGYSQDFDGLNPADGAALSNDGWLVFANVYGPDWAFWYNYGVFPAPNGTGGFCDLATDGANQYLNVYSDYLNANHGDGSNAIIQSITFNEQVIGPGDVGETWVFAFDAQKANLEGATTAAAFIKTLDPNAGYAETNYIPADMTSIPMSWTSHYLSIYIDPSLDGQLLQIGFSNNCSNYEGSGVYYDNIKFYIQGPVVSVENDTWGNVKSMFR